MKPFLVSAVHLISSDVWETEPMSRNRAADDHTQRAQCNAEDWKKQTPKQEAGGWSEEGFIWMAVYLKKIKLSIIKRSRKILPVLRGTCEMTESETASANNHMGIALPVWLAVRENGSKRSCGRRGVCVSLNALPRSEAPT